MEAVDSPLFRPITIGRLSLPGRLIKTATAETRATHDGFVTPELLQFYIPIAQGGTPLIITGNMYVCRQGKSAPRQLGVDDDDKIAGLRQLTNAVHAHGARMFAQLNHCGRQVVPAFAGLREAVSASAVKELVTGTVPRELTLVEIERVIDAYAAAAWRCKQAGFDGVQIHAANGYLMSQFLTPHTNRRTDRYGGSFDHRLNMLREVFRAIRARVGRDFPIIIKLNGSDDLPLRHGLKTGDLVKIAQSMEAEGADAVEISVGHYESGMPMVHGTFAKCLHNMTKGGMRYLPFFRRWGFRLLWPVLAVIFDVLWPRREGFNLAYAREFRRKLSIPVICVGGFRTRAAMEAALGDDGCDMVSAGRPFLADPFFYRHLRNDEAGPRCLDCNACIGHLGSQPADCYHPVVRAQKDAMLARL